MIVVRSPLRLSFFGGGTDIADYYKLDYGCVLGEAINKYVYTIINERFEKNIRISYLENEIVDSVNKIKHNIIRESLKEFKIRDHLEIVTVADVPGTGTGLGSSSSLTVGLCKGLSILLNKRYTNQSIAQKACFIEINKVKSPIGKQDQYFATFGGLCFLKFMKNECVKVEKINLSNCVKHELEENIVGFYTGMSRNANSILIKQKISMKKNIEKLNNLREIAELGRDHLKNGNLADFALLFDKSWRLKKSLSGNISNSYVDKIYKKGIDSGAIGGKLSGAGQGGFIFFYCEKAKQQKLKNSLKNLKQFKIKIDATGTTRLI